MNTVNHTSDTDEQLVKRLWNNEECPYFDLIMYANGKVFPLREMNKSNAGLRCMESESWIPISHIPDLDNPNKLNEGFAVICRKDFSEFDLSIAGGECCSSGQNGFVSITRLSSGDLIWLAFFLVSDPFKSIDLENGMVIAQSTANESYRFVLENPTSVEIVCTS